MGLDPAEGGWAVMGQSLAHRLARPRRPVRDLGLLPLGVPPRGGGGGAALAAGHAPEQAAERRPDDVLLPVPRPGGHLLRRAALPLRLPRPLGAGDRIAAATSVRHVARARDRNPAAPPDDLSAADRSLRTALAARRNRRPARLARHGYRT